MIRKAINSVSLKLIVSMGNNIFFFNNLDDIIFIYFDNLKFVMNQYLIYRAWNYAPKMKTWHKKSDVNVPKKYQI